MNEAICEGPCERTAAKGITEDQKAEEGLDSPVVVRMSPTEPNRASNPLFLKLKQVPLVL